jgi:hypothetical protein
MVSGSASLWEKEGRVRALVSHERDGSEARGKKIKVEGENDGNIRPTARHVEAGQKVSGVDLLAPLLKLGLRLKVFQIPVPWHRLETGGAVCKAGDDGWRGAMSFRVASTTTLSKRQE